ncbi:MAG: L-threonylcarbamoyladenylate synthase [Pseudomonadota bacterium]
MSAPTDPVILAAAATLRRGEVVAFPTETVYGLGADARNADAVRKVYALKGRPADHPLIVHVTGREAVGQWAAAMPEAARVLMARFWPGPLTLVLPARDEVSRVVTGGQDSVALRAPRHPVAQALLHAFGGGLAAPSANPFGRVSPTEAKHVRGYFPDLPVLDGGPCRHGLESTVVSLLGERPRVLRPGALPLSALRAALGDAGIEANGHDERAPRVPGALPAHYAPATPLELQAAGATLARRAESLRVQGLRVAVLCRRRGPRDGFFTPLPPLPRFLMPVGPRAYGRQLYARLREIDRFGFDRLLVEAPPADEDWWAINDRLARAANHSLQEVSS